MPRPWENKKVTDLDHMADHTSVCLAYVPFEMATHAHVLGHVPFRGIYCLMSHGQSHVCV
ncbi:hypothetical protein F383_20397 [Gossypium arboreum]|uniref:Uncharacterized protein n=1 Tax=Gossypium arboreum TaxID=29729 RepID=A0A0B0NPE1_GOSAR|nr:hypothetical protein F383_20397 [Gossypium arboreum]